MKGLAIYLTNLIEPFMDRIVVSKFTEFDFALQQLLSWLTHCTFS